MKRRDLGWARARAVVGTHEERFPTRRQGFATLVVALVSLGGLLVLPLNQTTSAAPAVVNNPPANPMNIIVFPSRDFISASGYALDDQVVVRVLHDPAIYPGAAGSTTGEDPSQWISATSTDPALPDGANGIVEVNHPGGSCWFGSTPDIRPGDTVQIEVMAGTNVGRMDETTVRNITAKRAVAGATPGSIVVHGIATDSFNIALNPGNPLPVAELEQRLLVPGDQFDFNGRRTLRAVAAAGVADGTVVYDAPGVGNPTGTAWTATYTGLTAADVTRALGAESRGMWLGATLTETTVFENGSLTFPGPTAPCTAPLEVLPPPPGSELIPPTAPTNLVGSVIGANAVRLTWDASTDNVGVTAYGILRNGAPIFTVSNPDGSVNPPTTFFEQNLAPGDYTFQVVALDEVGNMSDLSNTAGPFTAVAQLDVNTFPVNNPPVLPVNIITFPSRDFVSPSGYLDTDTVTVEVLRTLPDGSVTIVSSADGIIPIDGFAEVNHPGGACWAGVTPDLRSGDRVRTIAYNPDSVSPTNPDGIRTIDETTVAGVTAFTPVVVTHDDPNTVENEGVVQVHGTALGHDGQPIPVDQIEQRMIATHGVGLWDLNGRRALRAANAAGADGTLTYDTVNNPMGINWTATYSGLDEADVLRMADSDTRIHWLGTKPLLLAEATIFENTAVNTPGPAAPGCTRPLEPLDQTNPSTPGNQVATQTGPDTVTLTWDASTDDWSVAGYRVYQDGVAIANAAPTATSFVLQHIVVGHHTYEVRAFDNATPRAGVGGVIARIMAAFGQLYGNLSDSSGQLNLDQVDVTAPSVPADLSVTTTPLNELTSTLGTATLVWTASTDDVGVTGYNVYRNGVLVGTTNTTTFTDSGLDAANYSYEVEAFDAIPNTSAKSGAVVATVTAILDEISPTIPSNVTATTDPNVHGRNVKVSWGASTDNVRVAGYRVFRNGVQIVQVNGSTLTYLDANLLAGTYTYTVVAIDSRPNVSLVSNAATAVVANDPPTGSHSLIAFPARDFISATGYTPGESYSFSLVRGNTVIGSGSQPADATGLIEVNHPGGVCWNVNTPNIRPGDIVRITDSHGVADQTTVANVTAERPIAVNANTVVIHGTADDGTGHQIPVEQLDQRLIANRDLFDLNGRRTIRTNGGEGILTYDSPTSTRWTATYTGLSATDVVRAVGGTTTTGAVYVGAESRILWLGRVPLALNEATIFENGPGVTGGPAAPCTAPAETPAPAASLNVTTLSFVADFKPTVKTSGSLTVTFSNGGSAPLTLTNIYLAGLNPGDFSRTGGTCPTVFPATVLVGIPCTVTVAFKPTALNLRQASLAFMDDAANTTDQAVALTAIGTDSTDPVVGLTPSTGLAFGTVNGGATLDKVLTVSNTSGDPSGRSLTISSAAVGGANAADFTKVGDTCTNVPLAPGGSCTITVRFAPGARTARAATLTLTHNAAGPTRATATPVALSGTGGNGSVLSFSSTTIAFGTATRNTTKDQTISVKNSGNAAAALSLASFTVTGQGYTVRSTTCGNLAVNGSCNVVVRFTAPAAAGNYNGTLSVTAANGLPKTVTATITASSK
jgi:hypothetical protein